MKRIILATALLAALAGCAGGHAYTGVEGGPSAIAAPRR